MFELMEALSVDAAAGRAQGRARVPAEHPFLADHFPGRAVLPGSLQIELCAQVAGPLAEEVTALRRGVERWSFLGMVRGATFTAAIDLPADLVITGEVTRAESSSVVVTASISSERGAPLCRTELVMMLRPAEPEWADAIGAYRARIAAWKARA